MARQSLPPSLRERLRSRVRAQRERLSLTQEALAERAGCRVQTISRIENAQMQPSLGMLVLLAEALGCGVGDLVDEPADLASTEEERMLLELWRRAPEEDRRALLRLLGR